MNKCMCTVLMVGLVACAGDLEDKDRFAGLLDSGLTGDAGPDGGMSGTGGTGGGMNAEVPECVTAVLTERCGSQFCHAAGEAQVDLVSDGLAERLVEGESNAEGPCSGNVFISGSGGDSLLIQKVSDPDTCGTPMPVSGGALSTEQIDCLQGWVDTLGSGGM